jgi:hypothetical protein
VFLAVQALAASGQIDQKPPPKFKLTISEEKGWSANVHWLRVKETNLSHRVIQERWCIPLEYRDGFGILVLFNGDQMRYEYQVPFYAQRHATLQKQPRRCEGRVYRDKAQPGGSFVERLPLSRLFDMRSPGQYQVTVTESIYPTGPTSAAHPYKITTVNSNTLNIYVPRHVPPATTRPGAKRWPFGECLPTGITPDSVVKLKWKVGATDNIPPVKITVQLTLSKLGAYCTVGHVLVDGAGKPITFYQKGGCGGAYIPFSSREQRAAREEEERRLEALRERFHVIEMTCDTSGKPFQ